MPRTFSAAVDAVVFLVAVAALDGALFIYNAYLGAGGLILWLAMAVFAYDRCKDRERKFARYFRDVFDNMKGFMTYAVEKLPQAVIIVNQDGRVEWANSATKAYAGRRVEHGVPISAIWPDFKIASFDEESNIAFSSGERFFHAVCRPFVASDGMMAACYIRDVTECEELRRAYREARLVVAFIQVDNADELFQNISEAERTALNFTINRELDEWANSLGIYLRGLSDELYLAVMERQLLDKAMERNFDILDEVRQIKSANKVAATLSIGAIAASGQTATELGTLAKKQLDLALGRGGDQAAVLVDGKTQFFGGKTKASPKYTRVRSRVVAHALREHIENSDEVFIMGHLNEDFDALGAAIGVAKMAKFSGCPCHIVLSKMNDGIDKLIDLIKDKPEYRGLFITEADLAAIKPQKPLLIVVDVHIPNRTACPALLAKVPSVIVIDHHRRSETSIEKPILIFTETTASSTSEMVTELISYYDSALSLGRLDATALYAGIVVDTKNFREQTTRRTFEAAAYLKKVGIDPVIARDIFRTDYETSMVIAKAKAASRLLPGGLIETICPAIGTNTQAVAAQVADSFLKIDGIRMSVVLYPLGRDAVGISARSTGDLNVMVIMEQFGGGGHQNVAAAQVKGEDIKSVEERAVALCQKYIEENG